MDCRYGSGNSCLGCSFSESIKGVDDRWIMDWYKKVEIAEKLSIIIAALFLLLPLYQYLEEADDRRLDRLTRVVDAHKTCMEFGIHTIGETIDAHRGNKETFDGLYDPSQPGMGRIIRLVLDTCDEIEDETISRFLSNLESN